METHTAVPECVLRDEPHGARILGRVVSVVAVLVLAVTAFRFTFHSTQATFHNYGVVYTSIGIADVACGGEASSGCGASTAIRFASCSQRFHDYFSSAEGSGDQLVRSLIAKRPPSGTKWVVECGGADAMIHGQPLAQLKPS